MINERASDKGKIDHLEEEVALLRQRLFGRKTEQTGDVATPQLLLFGEAESMADPLDATGDEEVVAPTKRRSNASRCRLVCRVSKLCMNCPSMDSQSRQPYTLRICLMPRICIGMISSCSLTIFTDGMFTTTASASQFMPVTANKPAQVIEESRASPSVLAMLLTIKYVDGLPLHRFEKVLGRHGIDIPRQTLARWVIQCSEHLQPLLNLMRESLFNSRIIHCDETRAQVLKEPDREPSGQSWMWVQTGGSPDRPVILFDYATSRAREVPVRLLDGYLGYVMTDGYASFNTLAVQDGVIGLLGARAPQVR